MKEIKRKKKLVNLEAVTKIGANKDGSFYKLGEHALTNYVSIPNAWKGL